jgi:hypothetical protein
VTPVTVTAVPPLFVTLKACVRVPRNTTSPKSWLVGLTETSDGCGVASPASGTFTVPLAALADWTLRAPERPPGVVGPNSTLTVQVSSGARVEVSSQVLSPLRIAKALPTLTARPVRVASPVLRTANVRWALVSISTEPKPHSSGFTATMGSLGLSSSSGTPVPSRREVSDCPSSAVADSGVLTALLAWALTDRRIPSWRLTGVAGLLALAYGVGDEWHQTMVPTRTGRPEDLIWNGLGAAIAIALIVMGSVVMRRAGVPAERSDPGAIGSP